MVVAVACEEYPWQPHPSQHCNYQESLFRGSDGKLLQELLEFNRNWKRVSY